MPRSRAVVIAGQRHEIIRITARWRTPSGPAFRIETPHGSAYPAL
ncbi:MAG: hypothetical protein ACP5TV_11375 [Anaerolineae bacterium]